MARHLKLVSALIAFIIMITIHEGMHVLTGLAYNEFERFVIHPYGFEVIFKTPVELREGFKWFIISGTSNIVTTVLGYVMLFSIDRFINRSKLTSATAYWFTLLLLISDPLNLSINPFLFGGDAYGIVEGLNVPLYLVQLTGFLVFLINRELIAHRLLPAYNIETRHPLFVPWILLLLLPKRRPQFSLNSI